MYDIKLFAMHFQNSPSISKFSKHSFEASQLAFC